MTKSLKIFLSGFVCLGLSIVLVLYLDFLPSTPNYAYHTKTVSHKVNAQLKYIKNQASKLKQKINESEYINFTFIVEKFKYPYFIFEDGKLLFWSDNKVFPSYSSISGIYKYKFITLKNDKYLVCRYQFISNRGKSYEVFFMINLYSHYEIENEYLKSKLNEDFFAHYQVHLSDYGTEGKYNIFAETGEYLFSIEYDETKKNDSALWLAVTFILMLSGISLIILFIYNKVISLQKIEKYESAFLLILCSVVSMRAIMLYFEMPFFLVDWDIFNSKFYASSVISPSVGDLFINQLCVFFVLLYFFTHYKKTNYSFKLEKLNSKWKLVVAFVLLLLSTFSLYLVFDVTKSIFQHAKEVLDISKDIEFNLFKLLFILIFICLSLSYFIVNQIIGRLFLKVNKHYSLLYFCVLLLIVMLASSLLGYLYLKSSVLLSLLSVVYIGVIVYFKLPKTIKFFRYKTYLYFFLSAFVCAITGAIAVYEVDSLRTVNDKEKFSNSLLIENDFQGEYLLNEITEKINNDGTIKNLFDNQISNKSLIEQKVRRVYLNNYFDKYDIDIHLYNDHGIRLLQTSNESYRQVKSKYNQTANKTQYENLFYINESRKNVTSKYVSCIEMNKDGIIVGYILIELKLKKLIPNSVYPELLVDSRFEQETPRSYSYAIYRDHKMLYSYGDYNYTDFFKSMAYANQEQGNSEFSYNAFDHLIISASGNKLIVISSPEYRFFNLFSNFSFLLMVLMFTILLAIVSYSAYFNYTEKLQLNFSAKIQIYLNFSFFLPLLIVSVATLGIISADYKAYINDNFVQKAKRVRVNIADILDQYNNRTISKELLNSSLIELAKYSESDVNIFDVYGKLIATSQPLIYQSGLNSGLMNPEAYSKIVELKGRVMMIKENIGTLNYNAVYTVIKSPETGEVSGVLSIPYFHSKTDLEKHLIEVLNTIIDIFMVVFIFFLILSFITSRILTDPFTLITQKIKKISFSYENEPLSWNSKDEIGLLVGEYNKMLLKLVESKRILSQTEKESAWREMAQQVAHEIKNPLTPMKLSIQHLQRAMADNREDLNQLMGRSLQNLLIQVDTLSDIATSFSTFAKMPVPKNEAFEIGALLKQTVEFYNNIERGFVKLEQPTSSFMVLCDGHLMGRIISNLILNALQSVPNDRDPHVYVRLSVIDGKVLIEVNDNGLGIPEAIREKVFIPNFSTKYGGSGIGLAVAKRGVEHAGGKIWFETPTDRGTSFYIALPMISDEV